MSAAAQPAEDACEVQGKLGRSDSLVAATSPELRVKTPQNKRADHWVDSVGIVGASGAVGKEMISVLSRREFKCRSLRLFARRAAGEVYDCGRFGKVTVEPFSVKAAQDCAVVLLAVSGSFATQYAEEISGGPNNTVVIDNSSAFRYQPSIPLVIPEINGRKSLGERVIANPNCTTAIAAMALWPIHQKYRLRKVLVSTYQAASGAGAEGMEELKKGVESFVKDGTIPDPTVFQHPLAFNVIPHIDAFQENGYTKEEMKVAWELRKIFELPQNVKISCTAVRVPTLRAHSESIVIETEFPIDPAEVRALLSTSPGVKVIDNVKDSEYPLPARASGEDDVEVGRIRRSLVFGDHGIEFFLSGDQLLRGAALNAVLIAERVVLCHYSLDDPSAQPDEEETFPLIGAVPWQVHKFGGAALASAERYKLCAERLIAEHHASSNGWKQPIAAILSATEGMTDALIEVAATAATANVGEAIKKLADVVARQSEIARKLLPKGDPDLIGLEESFEADYRKLEAVLHTLNLLRSATDEACGFICGMGELWSSRTLTAVLVAMGATTCMLDARDVLTVADGANGGLGVKGAAMDMRSDVLYELSARKLEDWWEERSVGMFPKPGHPGPILIITGFIASTKSGVPTTLKRSGSDFSATIFARLLKAKEVTLWKTVDGVFTADPRMCKSAFPVPYLSYDEAIELAYFGGQVLHPLAMAPCIDDKITLVVRNILNVEFVGTRILPHDDMKKLSAEGVDAATPTGQLIRAPIGPVKVVTSIDNVAIIEVKAGGSDSVAEVTRRVMDVLHREGVQVIVITQASAEHSISVAVDKTVGSLALAALKRDYEHELVHNKIQGVQLTSKYSLVSVIGPMRGVKGTLEKLCRGISSVSANIYAAAQGSSERSISMVVDASRLGDVIQSVHDEFLGMSNLGLIFRTSVGGL